MNNIMPISNFKTLCSLGDSIMKGIVSVENEILVTKDVDYKKNFRYAVLDDGFVDLLQSNLSVRVENLALFGSTITKGLQCLARRKDRVMQCDHAFLEYGGNDCDFNWAEVAANPDAEHRCNTPMDLFLERYEEMVTTLRSLHVQPIMLSLPPLHPERFFNTISQGLNRDNIMRFLCDDACSIYRWHEHYNLAVFHLARKLEVPIVDITTPFLENLHYGDYLCLDGIHPNERGHKLIAAAIERSLNRLQC